MGELIQLLEFVGPAAFIALIFWIRIQNGKLDRNAEATNALSNKIDAQSRQNTTHDEKNAMNMNRISEEHSRQHREISDSLVVVKNTVMERVEKIMDDHAQHDRQNTRVETMVSELVAKSRTDND